MMQAWIGGWIEAHDEAQPSEPAAQPSQASAQPHEAAAEWVERQLRAARPADLDASRTGVYVATADAGADASIALWRDALASGAAFANPRPFVWTLASSPAAYIARLQALQGPNVTLVGGAEAALGALQHALCDLHSGRVTDALAAAIGLVGERHVAGLWLSARQPVAGAAQLCWQATPGGAGAEGSSAVSVFAGLCTALDAGRGARVTAPYEGTVILSGEGRIQTG